MFKSTRLSNHPSEVYRKAKKTKDLFKQSPSPYGIYLEPPTRIYTVI